MKEIEFLGNSLNHIKAFSDEAKKKIGYQLELVQAGLNPTDWKPMASISIGVKEIRVKISDGIYRTIYVANFKNKVYVLHAFKKKTDKTSQSDIKIARQRLKLIGD